MVFFQHWISWYSTTVMGHKVPVVLNEKWINFGYTKGGQAMGSPKVFMVYGQNI